jgi:soluble lytic murein transglycosylase-like protein
MSLFYLLLCATIVAETGEHREPLTAKAEVLVCESIEHVLDAASYFRIDPFVVAALIFEESRWSPSAVSHAGACGLTQVIPRYSKGFNCAELKSPVTSIWVGASMLDRWRKFRRKPTKTALACYNAGNVCGKSRRAKKYASRIMALASRYRDGFHTRVEQYGGLCLNRNHSIETIQRSVL